MSIRCFWLISTTNKCILYNRTFAAIESKAKSIGLPSLPTIYSSDDANQLVDSILTTLSVNVQRDNTIGETLNEIKIESLERLTIPALKITFKDTIIWPLVVCEQLGLLYCSLPLIELPNETSLVDHLSVSVSFAFLQQIMLFNSNNRSLQDLDDLLASIVPLGRYIGLLQVPQVNGKKQEESIISISVKEKISNSLEEGKDKLFGTIVVDTTFRKTNINTKSSINLLIRDLTSMDVAMSPACFKSNDECITVNLSRKEAQSIHYRKCKDELEQLIDYSYDIWKQKDQLYKVQLVISLSKLFSRNKLKFKFFSIIWREAFRQFYKPSNINCSHGQVLMDVNNCFVWSLGSKLPRTSKAVLSCDVTTTCGLGDILIAICSFQIEDWTMAVTLNKDCITVTDEFPPTTRILINKCCTSSDYRLKWNLVPNPSEQLAL